MLQRVELLKFNLKKILLRPGEESIISSKCTRMKTNPASRKFTTRKKKGKIKKKPNRFGKVRKNLDENRDDKVLVLVNLAFQKT